jgi:hypothetical protein
MASVKARSTGPKSGAPGSWHPPQHDVGAAKLRLAGLQHEVGGSSTTEWWTRWVTFPVSSTKRRQGWMATSPTAWHGCSSPAVLASSLPFFSFPLLLHSDRQPRVAVLTAVLGSGGDSAAPAAKGCSAPRVAALVPPFFLSLFFSSSSLVHGGGGGLGWGSGRPAGDWYL